MERTCRIGVGIKAASHGKVLSEDLLTFPKALQRSELHPLLPFFGPVFEPRARATPAPSSAGVETGDVITAMDGAALRGDEGGSPSEVLIAQMRNVDPGDSVTLVDGKVLGPGGVPAPVSGNAPPPQ